MNIDKFPELEARAADGLASKFEAMKEHAEHLIHEKAQQMISEGKAFELNDDEERLLKAYRSFKCRSVPGAVFSWECPQGEGIILPEQSSLIRDPREIHARATQHP